MSTLIAAPPAARLMTAAEFARRPRPSDGRSEELVRGEIHTMPPPGFLHGLVQGNLYFLIRSYLMNQPIGRVTGDCGVITGTNPDTVRGPDVAYWSFERLPPEQTPASYTAVAPDLVVEVVSPGNTRKELLAKLREYFRVGVRLVRVADPEDRTLTVYTGPGQGVVLWDDATLSGGEVLPGFSAPVAACFA